jgi:hypothetical protein
MSAASADFIVSMRDANCAEEPKIDDTRDVMFPYAVCYTGIGIDTGSGKME